MSSYMKATERCITKKQRRDGITFKIIDTCHKNFMFYYYWILFVLNIIYIHIYIRLTMTKTEAITEYFHTSCGIVLEDIP